MNRNTKMAYTVHEMRHMSTEGITETNGKKHMGRAVWVQDLEHDYLVAAIIDASDEDGFVAIWSGLSKYVEKDYGLTWIARPYNTHDRTGAQRWVI